MQFVGDVRMASGTADNQPAWIIDYRKAQTAWFHQFNGFYDEMREVRAGLEVLGCRIASAE